MRMTPLALARTMIARQRLHRLQKRMQEIWDRAELFDRLGQTKLAEWDRAAFLAMESDEEPLLREVRKK